MRDHVVVTYLPDAQNREVITRALEGVAQVSFAPDKGKSKRAGLIASADALIGLSFSSVEVTPEEEAAMRNVRLIQTVYAGVEKVPFDRLPSTTLVAGNAGAYAEPIAEHVLAIALALAKTIIPRHRELAQGRFNRACCNKVLKRGVCGIIGLGGNGTAVAGLMKAIGMLVWGVNRRGRTNAPVAFIGTLTDLKKVLEAADVVVITAPLTRQTANLIDAEKLAWMKTDALLVNVGRGEIIVQKDLYDHLRTYPDFGAGIDTWWSEPPDGGIFTPDYPFLGLPNLVGTPHNADHVAGIATEATRLAVANVKNFLEGKPVRGLADPEDYIVRPK